MRYRIALLADIHANVWALEAVLADTREQGVDVLWNLGDILHGDLKPRATYDLLRSTDVALTIRGNMDRELYEPNPAPRAQRMIRDLGEEPITWLRGLPAAAVFEDEVLLCHGSPTDDLCYLLEDVTSGHPQGAARDGDVFAGRFVRHSRKDAVRLGYDIPERPI